MSGIELTSIQPTAAKIADVFGRVELVLISIFFYVIGKLFLIEFMNPRIDFPKAQSLRQPPTG